MFYTLCLEENNTNLSIDRGGIINGKSLKAYGVLDLGAICIICFVLEIFATKFGGQLFVSCPSMVVSMLAVFLAIVRWNLLGLLVIPFAVCGNWIGGHWSDYTVMAQVYEWRFVLSSAIGYLSFAVNVIFYKKFTTKKCMNSIYMLVGFIILDYMLYIGVQLFFYNLFTSGNPFQFGQIVINTGQDSVQNVCAYVKGEIIYNLFAFAITIIGMILLRSQGAATNAVEKLVADRKEIELDIIDREFRIEEENSEQPKDSLESDEAQK